MRIVLNKKNLEKLLCNYQIGKLLSYKKINKGFANLIVQLKTDEGRFILKIVKRNNPYRVKYEVDLLNYLKGLSTPRLIKTKNDKYLINYNKTNKAFIYKYLDGKQISTFNKHQLQTIGRFLAKFHLQGKNFKSKIKRLEFYNISKSSLPKIIKFCQRIKNQEIKKQLIYLEKNLPKYFLPKDLPRGAMHIDLKPENALFAGNKLSVVDFDNSYQGPLILDLVSTIALFCSKSGKFNQPAAQIILKSYRKIRKLNKKEKKYFWPAIHFAFLSRILNDIYQFADNQLPLAYIRWGIENLLKTEQNIKLW